jgi:hypothetical protein
MKRRFLYWSNVLSSYRLYWWLRAAVRKLGFRLSTLGFSLRSAAEDLSSTARIWWSLFTVALGQVLGALLVSAATIYISSWLSTYHPGAAVPWVSLLRPAFQQVSSEYSGAYDQLLIGIITVVGLFLTLYFTNLGVLAQTVFPGLPNKLRSLLVEERVANAYVRFLMLLTLLSLIFLGYGVVTGYRANLIIVLIVFLSLFAVQAFARLSVRSYRFFDPTQLIWDLVFRFGKRCRSATYRRQAEDVLLGIEALISVAHDQENLRKESLTASLVRICGALDGYIAVKSLIPSDSVWYPRKPKYQSWYLSSSSAVGMASRTQTGIPPEMKPDRYWVETHLLHVLSESLAGCLDDGRYRVALSILDKLSPVFASLGRTWELKFAGRELSNLRRVVMEAVEKKQKSAEESVPEVSRHTEWYALPDYLGLLPISVFLGFREGIDALDLARLARKLDEVDWSNPELIYRLGLPAFCLEQAEYVKQRIQFERLAEGRVISAPWYIRQLIYQRLATQVQEQFAALLEDGRTFYLSAQSFIGKGRPLHAAAIITRGLEYCDKILVHLPVFENFSKTLDEARVEKSLRWPDWDWSKKRELTEDLIRELEVTNARLIPELSEFASIKDFPDYFTRAVHSSGEASFTALLSNDTGLFQNLFPCYFAGVFRILAVVGNDTVGWNPDMAVLAQVEPMIDLCTLSGYAFFMAEYHQNGVLWEACKTAWERYLSSDQKEAKLSWLAAVCHYSNSLFGITDRSILRSQWQMTVNNAIRRLPRKRSVISKHTLIPHERAVVDHPSLLVRVIGGIHEDSVFLMYDGLDIFIELYLEMLDPDHPLNFGAHKDLAESVERWKRNEEGGEDE